MSGSTLRRAGLAALIFSLALVLTIFVFAWWGWQDFRTLDSDSLQSRKVLEAAAGVYAGIRDAETGQRGFLLSGKDSYLQPYYIGSASAAQHLTALLEATRLQPDQRAKSDRLQTLVSSKLAELQQTIDARKTAGMPEALEILRTDRGKTLMDGIRQICTEIESSQYTTWSDETVRIRHHEGQTFFINAGGAALLFFLLTGALLAVKRYSFQRDRLFVDLEASKEEIVRAADLLQTTLASIGDAVITTDAQGRVIFMNPVAQALTGWTQEMAFHLHLDNIFRIVNEESRQTVESPVAKVLRLGSVVGLANHTILIRKDGGEIHIDDSGAPIRSRDGSIGGVVLVFRDIGERRKAEAALEAASRQTRDLLASISDGFITFDPAFCVQYANEAAARLLDCGSAARIIGNILWTECPSLSGTAFGRCMLRAMKDREAVEVDDLIGGRWLGVRAYPAQTGLSVYIVDITDKQHLSRDLLASRDRLHKSLSAAHAALWQWNLQSFETLWSDEFPQLFGVEERLEFSRAESCELLHPDDRGIFAAYLNSLNEGNRNPPQFEFRLLDGGEPRWISLMGEIVDWEEGRPARLAGLAIDVNERKRLEEKLRESAKLESLGILAGGIAHDFNNLLTAIIANAGIAADALGPAHPMFAPVSHVIEAGERAADLTRQMLAYSGKGSFVKEPLDLSKEVAEIVELLRASTSHTVELKLVLNDSLPAIEADAAQIQQLVMNLVINGAEAVGTKPGTVTVTTGVQQVDERYARTHLPSYPVIPGPYVVLEVQDTGHGMDSATQAKIFDPFFSTKFTGRGLGLAAVQGIIRGLKAGIEVHSNPGYGTTFRIFFPAAGITQPRAAAPPPAITSSGQGAILVADDEKMVQQVTSRALGRRGFEVLIAENGREAVDLFTRHKDRIRLVVLDLTMPVMSGEQALSEIRRLRPDIPVLAASGFSESDALSRFGGGVEGFLQKPYTVARLMEQVNKILGAGEAPPVH